jgi:hypothetical protein
VNMSPSGWPGAIVASIIAALIVEGTRYFVSTTRVHLIRHQLRARRTVLIVIIVAVTIANPVMWWYLGDGYILFFAVSALVLWRFLREELNQFWQVGLIGADRQVEGGVNYSSSLQLCNDSLDFLGIGASKLVRETREFVDAINRCHRSGRPIRFLLCRPDNEQLIEMARQAGRPDGEYQKSVRDSLKVLAELRCGRAKNIEVRFYSRLPLFRLMFIDDSLCLASHYVFGEGDGSHLPQLHVIKSIGLKRRDVESLYHPLRTYFEQLWDESERWDPNAILD